MVSYKPLWHLLVQRDMSKRELMLMAGIAPNTMTKLRRNEEVSMTVLTKICKALNVTYGDIVEYIPEKEGNIKHIYFVAETKGSMNSMQLRLIEESKIHCAREHIKAISNGNVVYDVVDSYQSLLEKVMK